MGKKRVVSKEEEEELEENLKRAKKPLQVRDGILSRTEFLRQVFQGELETYNIDWLAAESKPFPVCQLSEFLSSPSYSLSELEDQLSKLELKTKKNDLYQFSQSSELMTLPEVDQLPRLAEFRGLMKNFWPLMSAISGHQITDMSMFYAEYKYTDHLLPHEDDLENRVIAFVYYLNSDDWVEKDGGFFDSYISDEQGQPVKIHKEWLPRRNYLNFFKVTDASFHQVREVTSRSKIRKSISGWFHTSDPLPPRNRLVPMTPKFQLKEFNSPGAIDYRIEEWISMRYLDPNTMGDIQVQFEDSSEIQLVDILVPQKYQQILECLEAQNFKETGPFQRKRTLELSDRQMFDEKSPLGEFMRFLVSDHFFLLLSNWTGLKLHPEAPVDDEEDDDEEEEETPTGGAYRCQVRKWTHGNYTLLHDAETEERGSLDMFMYFFSEASAEMHQDGWDVSKGGAVSYITKGEDEELLTVCPKANSLSLVFRDADTLRFSKFLNKKTANDGYFDVFNCYYE